MCTVLQIKATLEVNMCTLFLLDDTTQELICPVSMLQKSHLFKPFFAGL